MFKQNNTVDRAIGTLIQALEDLDLAASKHHAEGAYHQEEHIKHMEQANRALRIGDKLREIVK